MADAQDSATTMDAPENEKKGMFSRFGRRKDDTEVRTETEWVDTLVAHEGDPEPIPEGSPFAAGDEPATFTSGFMLPESLPAPEPAPEPLAAEGTEEVHEKSWVRKHGHPMDDIHHYVDRIIGTELDPARRRRAAAMEVGRTIGARDGRGPTTVAVEGIGKDLMIAFTFPEAEFRGARVVYETDGGYVIEVRRAVGGNDRNVQQEYYTVSRVGEVAHVLDQMRAREMMRAVETETTTTTTTRTTRFSEEPPAEAVHPIESVPAFAGDPELPGVREVPEPTTTPASVPAEPITEPFSPPEAPSATPETAPWPPEDVGMPSEEVPAADEGGKRFGLFRRKGGEGEAMAEAPVEEGEAKRSLFRRKSKEGGEVTEASPEAEGDAKRKGFSFRRKKDGPEEEESPFT